jgi:hypothetical protein
MNQCPVKGCGRPSLSRSRHCGRHNQRMTKYGHAEGTSVNYRDDVKPNYHAFCAEGLSRLKDHPATQAGIELAQMLLDWRAPPDSIRHKVDTRVALVIASLRDEGITAEQLSCRVAEIAAYLKIHPVAARNTRVERFIYARAVAHLIRRNLKGQRPGAEAFNALGEMITAHLGVWAAKFINKLERDLSRKEELRRMDYD